MKHSIDTSAIMDGCSRYLPPDIFPALWDRIERTIRDGQLRATEEVRGELERWDESAFEWADGCTGFFVDHTAATIERVRAILVSHPTLVSESKKRSLCDPWVIAVAQINGCAVVTGEVRTMKPSHPKIPDVCEALGITCMSIYDMIRAESWKF